jgi:hypothetical protein
VRVSRPRQSVSVLALHAESGSGRRLARQVDS